MTKAFEIKVKNKKLLKTPAIRKWISDTEKYLNFKLEREIKGLLQAEVTRKVNQMVYGRDTPP
jgi:hypothetical protein